MERVNADWVGLQGRSGRIPVAQSMYLQLRVNLTRLSFGQDLQVTRDLKAVCQVWKAAKKTGRRRKEKEDRR